MAAPMAVPQGALAGDAAALARLRERAGSDPKAAVREAARQFEALFMQEVMKSMRAATLATGSLDNEGSKLGTEMLDQQFAQQLAGLPGGLSEAIVRQLERHLDPVPPTSSGAASGAVIGAGTPAAARPLALTMPGPAGAPSRNAAEFVERHTPAARAAEAASGIPAAFMIGQAAHETGWGRQQIVGADGTASHNLFGIKAGADWKGRVVEAATTEVIDGRAVRTVARFRAYANAAESFADYARLMQGSPRYREVLAQRGDAAAFAGSLQRAGYATDPAYAAKLTRVINTTLRLQRAAG
jgi:flagellar protein FlgJ